MTESKRNFTEDQRTCDAATAGPWGLHDAGLGKWHVYDTIGGVLSSVAWDARIDDAVFIAEARTGWPAALERIRAQDFEIERLRRGYDKLREYVEQQAGEGWFAPNALLDEIDAEEVSE